MIKPYRPRNHGHGAFYSAPFITTLGRIRIPLLAALLLTQACGFHLRGSDTGRAAAAGQNAARSVYLHTTDGRRALQILQQQLGQAVKTRRSQAEYEIRISGESIRQNVLSVSPATGKVEEFKVNYSCLLSIIKTDTETGLINNQRLSFSRDYTFDEDAVLGKADERRQIEEELINQAAQAIIRRFRAVTSTP